MCARVCVHMNVQVHVRGRPEANINYLPQLPSTYWTNLALQLPNGILSLHPYPHGWGYRWAITSVPPSKLQSRPQQVHCPHRRLSSQRQHTLIYKAFLSTYSGLGMLRERQILKLADHVITPENEMYFPREDALWPGPAVRGGFL